MFPVLPWALSLSLVAACAGPHPNRLVAIEGQANAPLPSPAVNLRLITFNVWGLPGIITRTSSARYDRIAAEIDQSNPDILLLQEVWTRRSRETLVQLAQTNVPTLTNDLSIHSSADNNGWTAAYTRPTGNFFGQNGLVILSRLPILAGGFRSYSRGALPDSLMKKGALKVTLDLGGDRRINVWNTHLQCGWPKVCAFQIAELVRWVNETDDGQVADLIGGDFNCTPDSPQYRALVDGLGPCVNSIAGQQHFVTWRAASRWGRGRTLDYVFVRPGRGLERVQASLRGAFVSPNIQEPLSDHLALETFMGLKLTSGAALAAKSANGTLNEKSAPEFTRVNLGVLSLASP